MIKFSCCCNPLLFDFSPLNGVRSPLSFDQNLIGLKTLALWGGCLDFGILRNLRFLQVNAVATTLNVDTLGGATLSGKSDNPALTLSSLNMADHVLDLVTRKKRIHDNGYKVRLRLTQFRQRVFRSPARQFRIGIPRND